MKTLIFLLPLFAVSAVGYGATEDYFTAAVFEKALLKKVQGKSPREIVETNLNLYKKAAQEAVERNADIIVYGEFGLFPYVEQGRDGLKKFMEYVPDPKKNKINPCTEGFVFEDRPILSTLSCVARNNNIYVVANMVDGQPCTDQSNSCDASKTEECQGSCPSDEVFMYNTDVVFDRDGNLIARYHKNHLYFEEMNTPVNPEYVTFKTDFGTFGLIVCFDSVFQHSVNLVKNHGVDNLLFLTHWFDDILPFNAIEWQQSWAFANNVNVLAANIYTPGLGTIGSGIYSKKYGFVSYTYDVDGNSKLVVGRLPLTDRKPPHIKSRSTEVVVITENSAREKEETGENFPEQCYEKLIGPSKDNLADYRCFKSQLAKYTLTKLQSGKHEVETCDNGFCCSFKYSADIKDENYYIAVFNGLNDVKDYFRWHEENCFLVRCDAFEGKECALLPSKAKSVFHYVEVKATFTAEKIYPAVSKTNNRLAPKYEWDLEKSGQTAVLSFKNKSNDPLLKIGLLGRCYSKDEPFIPFYKY